ncbi:MAG TPA: acyl-CoA dehydrogenase family protein [Candidatus Binatia bacterium]|jgi:alkylation response protein AidB-like acyl-CoA dehydrogenase|nr:acyl-CoA dehydrogenase family protein [Candidatus Binatia bacterium]
MSALKQYLDRIDGLAPLVREQAAASEREGQLTSPVVEALHVAGLFRIFLPAAMDGGDVTIPESVRLFEAMARLDASAGWNLAICAGGPLFGHFASKAAFDDIFSDPRAVVAGTLNPLGTRALPCDGGWRFSGRASYVSGSAHATWLNTAAVEVHDGGPRIVEGMPAMRTGLFPMTHCRILDTWAVTGMRGTGSNDCVFEDVFVPDAYTYEWPNPRSTWRPGAFAVVPLTTQLGGSLAAVALGAARHAIDALMELATAKVPTGTRALMRERPLMQQQLGQAEGWLQAGRAYLFAATDEVWRRGEQGIPFDLPARAAARLAAVTATKLAAQAVDLVHDAAGMSSVQTSSEIDRCWRDVHTITQHVILGTGRYEVIGRVMMGLDPESPII